MATAARPSGQIGLWRAPATLIRVCAVAAMSLYKFIRALVCKRRPPRAICSTLIAQAFQSVRYPILPRIERVPRHLWDESVYSRREILHIRHHSLFAPRDFDLSPYFQIVKPTIESSFDHHKLNWADKREDRAGA